MHIAALPAADAPGYRALMLHAYAVAADAFASTAEERAAEPQSWWIARIAGPEGLSRAFGAFDGDELVGTVTVEFLVKPKTRHKALVQAALAAAAARLGVQVVTLTVTEGSAAAIALYEACGSRIFGVEPMAIATPAGFRSRVLMWLALRGAAAVV